jgi:hypothetical protein
MQYGKYRTVEVQLRWVRSVLERIVTAAAALIRRPCRRSRVADRDTGL